MNNSSGAVAFVLRYRRRKKLLFNIIGNILTLNIPNILGCYHVFILFPLPDKNATIKLFFWFMEFEYKRPEYAWWLEESDWE